MFKTAVHLSTCRGFLVNVSIFEDHNLNHFMNAVNKAPAGNSANLAEQETSLSFNVDLKRLSEFECQNTAPQNTVKMPNTVGKQVSQVNTKKVGKTLVFMDKHSYK